MPVGLPYQVPEDCSAFRVDDLKIIKPIPCCDVISGILADLGLPGLRRGSWRTSICDITGQVGGPKWTSG